MAIKKKKKKIYTGPRGGRYTIDKKGRKQYIPTGKKSNLPQAGWAKMAPKRGKERTMLMKVCGPKCFLLPSEKKFPICPKGDATGKHTCKPSSKGLASAYIRARQWKYSGVAQKARDLQKKYGYI